MMKNNRTLTYMFLGLLTLTSCQGGGAENLPFIDVKDIEAHSTYTFASSLPSEEELYPLSTGPTYYFSSSVTTDGDGSLATPFKSLSSISSITFVPGTSLLFKSGETFEGNIELTNVAGSDDNPITLASYGEGARPIIDGPKMTVSVDDYKDTIHFGKASNIVVRDLEVRVYSADRMHASGVSRTGIHFSYNFVGNEKFKNIYVVNNEVIGNGVRSNTWGIALTSLESSPASSPRRVVDNVHFLYNTTHDFGRTGIRSSGWLTSSPKNGNNTFMDLYTNLFFNHNTVYRTGTIGMYIVGGTNGTINYNTVYDTGLFDENQLMEGECGIMALGADSIDIMFNEVYDVYDQNTGYDAMGIDIDWNTTNIRVMYNYVHDCQGSGIGTMANQNSVILNNRLENNRGETNHPGAITLTNYTSRYECVEEDMHSIKNLQIADNLVIQSADKPMLIVSNSNGDADFENNVFERNHLVYTGDDLRNTYFINVDAELPWYKFAANKYYSSDTSVFRAVEMTDAAKINIQEGAAPYRFDRADNFGAWAKRDLGATYELLSDSLPAMPIKGGATYEDGKITLQWESNKVGTTWHYNVYDTRPGESASYLNMVGETFTTSFTFSPKLNGVHRYIIQPESDQGVLGRALIIQVTL